MRSATAISGVTGGWTGDYPMNSMLHQAVGRSWIFYSNWGVNHSVQYVSSTDKIVWSSAGVVTTGIAYPYNGSYSSYYDNTNGYFHVAYIVAGSSTAHPDNIYYIRGLPSTAGTVSWDSAQIVTTGIANYGPITIATDTSGRPWIGYGANYSASGNALLFPYVIKSTTSNGTWTSASGYPIQLSTAAPTPATGGGYYAQGNAIVTPISGSSMYIIYGWQCDGNNQAGISGRLYNGTTLGSEVFIASGNTFTNTQLIFDSAVTDPSGVIHLLHWNNYYSYSGSWSSGVPITRNETGNQILMYDTTTSSLIMYEQEYPGTFYSRALSNGSWGSETLIGSGSTALGWINGMRTNTVSSGGMFISSTQAPPYFIVAFDTHRVDTTANFSPNLGVYTRKSRSSWGWHPTSNLPLSGEKVARTKRSTYQRETGIKRTFR